MNHSHHLYRILLRTPGTAGLISIRTMSDPFRIRNARTGTRDEADSIGPLDALAYTAYRKARAAARR